MQWRQIVTAWEKILWSRCWRIEGLPYLMYRGVWQGRKQLRGPSKWRAAGFLPRWLICMGGTILCWSRKKTCPTSVTWEVHPRPAPCSRPAYMLPCPAPPRPAMIHASSERGLWGDSGAAAPDQAVKKLFTKKVGTVSLCVAASKPSPPPPRIFEVCAFQMSVRYRNRWHHIDSLSSAASALRRRWARALITSDRGDSWA